MKKTLVLVGGGGHCKSVLEVARQLGVEIKGILDLPEYVGDYVAGVEVIGTDDMIENLANECMFVVTLGSIKNPENRIKLHRRIIESGGDLATLVSPTATVSPFATIGAGTVILNHCCINADAEIGMGCIINNMANIEHDCVVGDFTHISTGALINGEAMIGNKCFLGSGSVLCNGVAIVDGCIIGAGAVVCKSCTTKGTYVGVPAKLVQ